MESEKSAADATVTANKDVQAETRAAIQRDAPRPQKPAPDVGDRLSGDAIAPFIQKFGDGPIAEIERVIGELNAARNHLKSEADRIHHETIRYAQLNEMASASVRIILDSLREWREAGHPVPSRAAQ
jgi:hypothetical protein